MGYGTSLGTAHEDEISSVLEPLTSREISDRKEINANEASGDFQSRFGSIDIRPVSDSTMPLEASRKLTDALKRSRGTEVPGNEPETNLSAAKQPASEAGLPDIKDVQPTFAEDIFGKGENDIRPALSHFYETVKNAFKLPGDVYSGKVPAGSIQEIERATDLAGLMVMGPAPVAAKMADGSLGSFIGVKAKTFDKKAMSEAQEMEMVKAAHPDDIWGATGTFRGTDKRWRQEISDKDSVYTPQSGQITNLASVLDHPELYKAYPQLKSIGILKAGPSFPAHSAEWDNIYGGSGRVDSGIIRMGSEAIKDKSTLMHEVQHAIQDIEGFAKGGMPGKAGKNYDLKYEEAVDKLRPEYTKLVSKIAESKRFPSEPEFSRYVYLNEVMDKYAEYKLAGDRQAAINYLRLAGEAEARNVQTRIKGSAKDLRRVHPDRSLDEFGEVKNQIVVGQPVATSPYGVRDPITGNVTKSEPIPFRRGANENLPVGHPDRPYNIREPNMIGSKEMDDAIDKQWKELGIKQKKDKELLAERHKMLDTLVERDWSEIEYAKYNKLGRELFGEKYSPITPEEMNKPL